MRMGSFVFVFIITYACLDIGGSYARGSLLINQGVAEPVNISSEVLIDGVEFISEIAISQEGEPAVPLKDLADVMGYSYKWDAEKRHIVVDTNEDSYIVPVSKNWFIKNGSMMYAAAQAYILSDRIYLPLLLLKDMMGMETVEIIPAQSGDIRSVILKSNPTDYYAEQERADSGIEGWRLVPVSVAENYVREVLRFRGGSFTEHGPAIAGRTRVSFIREDGSDISIDLFQPAKRGEGGIWSVEYWFDSDSKMYRVRDITKLLPLFHNEEKIPSKYKNSLRDAIIQKFIEKLGADYEILGFESGNVDFGEAGGRLTLSLNLNVITRYFYRDPDTAEYIADAKKRGSDSYLTMYYEYNAPKESNYVILVEAELLSGGGIGGVKIYRGGDSSGWQRFHEF